jgi:hypothetical protein
VPKRSGLAAARILSGVLDAIVAWVGSADA